MPQRKLGYNQQNSENDFRLSPELSEEGKSRKTDSGSSLADEKHSAFSGHNLMGQNFSYSNFHSFGGNSPQQSENYPPKLQHMHSHNSVISTQNSKPFDNNAAFPLFEQQSEWIQHNYPVWPSASKDTQAKTKANMHSAMQTSAWMGGTLSSNSSTSH